MLIVEVFFAEKRCLKRTISGNTQGLEENLTRIAAKFKVGIEKSEGKIIVNCGNEYPAFKAMRRALGCK